MKCLDKDKNEIKKLLYISVFSTKSDSTIIYNLFNFIDSMSVPQLKKTKIFLKKNENLKVLEVNKKYLEKKFDLKLSTAIIILILFKIVYQDQNEEMRFLINKYLKQENYRHFIHILNYVHWEIFQNILDSINFEYENKKNIFQKLKEIFVNLYNKFNQIFEFKH